MTLDLKQEIVECGNTLCKNFQTEENIEQYLKEETDASDVEVEYSTTTTTWAVNIYFTFDSFRRGDIELIKKLFEGINYTISTAEMNYGCVIHIKKEV